MEYTILNHDDLEHDRVGSSFEGYKFGDTPVCIILVDAGPGEGPRLHVHPYQEIFVVQEGRATYTIGTEAVEVTAGQIVIAPAGVPHKFVNSGDSRLRQVDIHLSPKFITEWIDD